MSHSAFVTCRGLCECAISSLVGMSTSASVSAMVSDGVDVLVDLNGHTLRSGLSLLALRPAAVQATFLGYSLTTALPAVDYYIGDALTTPHWMQPYFTEKLVRPAPVGMVPKTPATV